MVYQIIIDLYSICTTDGVAMGKSICRIIGTKKSNATKQVIRYFRERKLPFQFVDLQKEQLSDGELAQITATVDPEELIDTTSAIYKKRGYAYMDYNPVEELMEYPLLLRMPVVRLRNRVLLAPEREALDKLLEEY